MPECARSNLLSIVYGIPQGDPVYVIVPKWLRGTSMGDTLSEADWCMKSLQVGVQSNKEKTKFWSRQKKSNLDGLATTLDFPKDKPPGSVFMSCESARVEKDENEITFPEEPKMRIACRRIQFTLLEIHH